MNSQVLIDEIKQISTQYNAEVGRSKKAWPKAIRERVCSLLESGMPSTRVSAATGIPYFTVLQWRTVKGRPRKRLKGFKELAVSKPENLKAVATVTVPLKLNMPQKTVTVTVTTFDGFKLEMPSTDDAVDLILKLRQQGGSRCS